MSCKEWIHIFDEKRKVFSKQDIKSLYEDVGDTIARHNLSQSPEIFVTIVSELIQNAEKANAKKWLMENESPEITYQYLTELQVGDEVVYQFKEDFNWKLLLSDTDKWIKLIVLVIDGVLQAKIVNNSPLNYTESYRIRRSRNLSTTKTSFVDLFGLLHPKAELGGIGLAMSFQLMKSEGFDQDLIVVEKSGDITYSTFYYPTKGSLNSKTPVFTGS